MEAHWLSQSGNLGGIANSGMKRYMQGLSKGILATWSRLEEDSRDREEMSAGFPGLQGSQPLDMC